MAEAKKPKWESGVAVSKGKQTISLLEIYESDLTPRLAADGVSQYEANVTVLEKKLSGREAVLSTQKSSTAVQNTTIKQLHSRIVSVRNIVRSTKAGSDIRNAFGIGAKIQLTVMGVANAADVIVTAYNQNTDWSNAAGIIAKDIKELTDLTSSLFSADDVQEKNIFTRKASTMSVDTLQRLVEDETTRISSLGYHEYELKDPAIAKLFADLIPSSVSIPPKTDATPKP